MADIAYINGKRVRLEAEANRDTGLVFLKAIDQLAGKIYHSDERHWDHHRHHLERSTDIGFASLDKAGVTLTLAPYKVNFGDIETSDTQLRQLGMELI